MDISVPSRFACLKIEDDEFRPASNKSGSRKKPDIKSTKKGNGSSTMINSSSIKKPPIKQTTNSSSAHTKKTKKSKQDNKQWEEWKKRDDEIVDDNFEQDLQSAILQSKLDYERQKKNVVHSENTTSSSQKKKKSKTMSLDQFLENGPTTNGISEPEKPSPEEDFFEKALESAKQEINRERAEGKRKEREANIEEIITVSQYQEKLEKQRAKNEALQKELDEARTEISVVKKRNTLLCSMLSQGEMKDKAEVLLELERLTVVKEELTEEVSRLHKLLEQERSKANVTADSHSSKHKEKKSKKK